MCQGRKYAVSGEGKEKLLEYGYILWKLFCLTFVKKLLPAVVVMWSVECNFIFLWITQNFVLLKFQVY